VRTLGRGSFHFPFLYHSGGMSYLVAPREYRIPSHPQGVSSSHLIGSLAPVEQEDERPCMVMRLMMRPLYCLGLRLELEQKP